MKPANSLLVTFGASLVTPFLSREGIHLSPEETAALISATLVIAHTLAPYAKAIADRALPEAAKEAAKSAD